MRAMSRGWLLAVVLAVPLAGAVPTFPLQGSLQWEAPAHTDGLLTTGADLGQASVVAPAKELAGREVLTGPHVMAVLHQWIYLPPAGATPDVPIELDDKVSIVEGARLVVDEVGSDAQFLVDGAVAGTASHDIAKLGVAACDVRPSARPEPLHFPHSTAPELTHHYETHEGRAGELQAGCSADGFAADAPSTAYFWSMKLTLYAKDGSRERFETGDATAPNVPLRAGDASAPTLMWRQASILQIIPSDGPMTVVAPAHAQVWLRSTDLNVVGRLALAPTEGRLVWGDRDSLGRHDAFAAEGAFALEGRTDGSVALDGRTRDAPGTAALAAAGVAPSGGVPTATAGAVGSAVAVAAVSWFLFSKIAPDDLLTHPRRARILELVRAEPGVETNAVARALGLRWPKAAYHVQRLAQGGHIVVRRVGSRTALFPAGAGFRGRETEVVLLRRRSHRRAYELLAARPGLDQNELAFELGLHQSQVSRLLASLRGANLVDVEPGPGRTRYRALATAPVPTERGTATA